MKLITVHLKDNEPIRIKCDSYRLNSDNTYEFVKYGEILTQYNLTKDDVIKIDDPPKIATGKRLTKSKL